MTEKKKDLIRDVTKLFNDLPDNKKERAIGIMQGMLMAADERECGGVHADQLEPIKI